MSLFPRLAPLAGLLLAAAPALAAEERAYLAPAEAAAILADGVAWSASGPNGRDFKLVLNRDGTGSIRGGLPMTLSTNWSLKGDDLCIVNSMISRCLRFTKVPGGYQSWEDGKPALKLSR